MRALLLALVLLTTTAGALRAQTLALRQKPAGKPAPSRPMTPEEEAKLFGEVRKSEWVLEELRGPVPEPSDDTEQKLTKIQDMLVSASMNGVSPEAVQSLSKLLTDIAVIPPEQGLISDFTNDLLTTLTDLELARSDARRLTQLLYAALNSAALGRPELRTVQEGVSSLLRQAGADKNRIQTLLFNIMTINELIKGGGGA